MRNTDFRICDLYFLCPGKWLMRQQWGVRRRTGVPAADRWRTRAAAPPVPYRGPDCAATHDWTILSTNSMNIADAMFCD
ncbi:unnamed protein product [Leptosia nina]|uniref:Uncharacterized protein n=1 Tax=Leptosia nina TaxID=320188 RepID=A0AAV1J6P2_9NEOP